MRFLTMHVLFFSLQVFTLVASSLLGTASIARSQVTVEFDEEARNSFEAATTALTALASDDSLAAGSYRFKSDVDPDTDLNLYKIVGEFPIGPDEAPFVPLLEISPSYSRLEQDFTDTDTPAEIDVDTWSIGVGAGLQINLIEDVLQITPRFKLEYSKVDFDISIPGVDGSLLDDVLPEVDTWSYIPSLEGVLHQRVSDDGAMASLGSRLSYHYVDASTSNDNLEDFSEDSWIWRNRLSYDQPIDTLYIRPSLGRVDISGAARDGLELSNFWEFGLDVYTRNFESSYLKEFGVGVTYVYEKDLDGWRVGILGKLS